MASMTYVEFDLGSKIFGSGTVTEAHIVNAAGLFNDFNPLHVQGTATNQRQQLVVEATNKVLITNLVPAWAVGR